MINFFGCSFTEGGGLDDAKYYNFKNNTNLQQSGKDLDIIRNWRDEHRYSNLISKKLDTPIKNYAEGANSNENIFNKLFEIINLESTEKNDIFIVQLTIPMRRYYWYEPENRFFNINAIHEFEWPYRNENKMMALNVMYKMYLEYSYNEKYENQKILNNIDLFNEYSKNKGIKIFWTPWTNLGNYQSIKNKNIIFFDEDSMGTYIDKNNLTIKNDNNVGLMDMHKSIYGHEVVANKIVEYLKDKI
jgi:hypothetical protein